jgi:putative heme-binding domain-containing protein
MKLVIFFWCAAFAQTPDDLARGKHLFEAQCALCHGMDGRGGKGAVLAVAKFKHAADDKALITVIREGIEGTEMPGAWWITEREATQVANYVRTLGRTAAVAVPGNVANGQALFAGKAGCAGCHAVRGSGGTLGPELTDVGARRSPDYLRRVLDDPAGALPEGFLMVRVVTSPGREVRGVRMNEDSFTIQIKDLTGRFHSFRKSELAALHRETGQTPMPSYRGKLEPGEFDDLIAYLVSLRGEK